MKYIRQLEKARMLHQNLLHAKSIQGVYTILLGCPSAVAQPMNHERHQR